ncbi:hypothetical protein HWI79_3213 [Cryptosporidium felis]|nr:hypothetical protein HWI79_3213 [Cryptosporidium felis]
MLGCQAEGSKAGNAKNSFGVSEHIYAFTGCGLPGFVYFMPEVSKSLAVTSGASNREVSLAGKDLEEGGWK